MTKVEFLNAISAGNMNDELMAYAAAELEKDAARKAAAKSKPSKAWIENLALIEKVLGEFLTDEAKTAGEVAEFLEVKTPKATAILKQAVAMGFAEQDEVKKPGKGTCKVYTKIAEFVMPDLEAGEDK